MRLPEGPLAAFVELRLRLGLRRFRARGGVAELVARILSYVVLAPAALLFAAAVGAGTFRAARAGQGLWVDVPITGALFGIWQAWTAVALSLQEREGLDLRRFLLYPVPPWKLHAYGMAASVVGDPFALFWCVLLAGAFGGAALGRPGGWLLLLAVTLLLFAAATASWLVLIQEVMARVLRGRRTREVFIALLYVGMGFGGAVLAASRRTLHADDVKAVVAWLQWVAWPAAFASAAARPLFAGRVAQAALPIAGLLATTAAATWAGYRLTLASARSGDDGPPARGSMGGTGWALGRLPGRLGPLLEREVKQLLRHPLPGVLLLVLPGMAGLAAWKALPLIPPEAGEVLRALPLVGFALYTHLATQVFWLNAFGWDRGGARLLFLAPLDLGHAVAAKNGAAYLLSAVLYLASAGLALLLAGAPPGWAIAAAAILHLGLAPWLYGLGNLVSVLNPRASSMSLQRSGSLPALSSLAGMAIIAAVGGVFALPVLLALRLDEGWVLPVAWGALGLLGLVAYQRMLPRLATLVAGRKEPLLSAVTGDEG